MEKASIDARTGAARVRAVSDQERKGKSSERDEEEEKPSEEEASEEEGSDEESSEEESEEEGSEDEESEDEASDEEKPAEGEEDEEAAARAQRVAEALGVGEEEGEAKAEAEEAAPPPNRAQRRAEAAQRRKKRKAGGADEGEKRDDEALPKDKNARAKELLKRRREQAAGEGGPRPVQLLPGEMVDDALARGSSAVSKWIRDNFGIIQWVILAALVGGGGYLFYLTRSDKTAASASSELIAGIEADRGRVLPEDKRSDEEKAADPTKVFKTADERADTALASYKKVETEHAGTGAAILAVLGEAGDYLDKHDYVHALEGFSAVSSSTLAGADPDVKGRALEGLGFAKEGKGDIDGALATFKELEGVDARGYKELGLYHQGRIWLAKGDKEKAKDFLKQAHDKLEQPTTEGQLHYLQQVTDEALRRIDPSLVPAKTPTLGGPKGGAMTADEIEKIKRQLQDALKQKGDKHP